LFFYIPVVQTTSVADVDAFERRFAMQQSFYKEDNDAPTLVTLAEQNGEFPFDDPERRELHMARRAHIRQPNRDHVARVLRVTNDWPGAAWEQEPLSLPVSMSGATPGQPQKNLRRATSALVEKDACTASRYYGNGPGAWYVCESPGLRSNGCAVVSVGIAGEDTFEANFARTHPNCQVYMLDPTPWVARKYARVRPESNHTNLHFIPIGLGAHDGTGSLPRNAYTPRAESVHFTTLANLRKRWLGTRKLTILKMDIEGVEWSIFNATNASAHTDPNDTSIWTDAGHWSLNKLLGGMSPPDQLLFELHDGPPVAWRGVLHMLYLHGYRLWKATNPRFTGGGCGRTCRYPGLTAALRPLTEFYLVRQTSPPAPRR
jgi:hypothetical protein